MPLTQGINHLGLSVRNLQQSRDFFVELLGWDVSGVDLSYPRCAVSDGQLKLTLWQVKNPAQVAKFSRRENVGLHHLALQVISREMLDEIHLKVQGYRDAVVEFAPELLGQGPRMHMMCSEPGGLRIEFIWPGDQ